MELQNVSNILEYLEQNSKLCGDKTAVVQENVCLSYRELTDTAQRFGSSLAKRTEPGRPVVILAEKSPLTLAAMFGAVYAGCFYVPVHPQLPVDRIRKILEVLETKVVVTTRDMQEKLQECGYEGVVIYQEDFSDLSMAEALDEALLEERRTTARDTDYLYGIFTSGSTGTPKCIVVSHRAVIDFISHFTEIFGITGEDRIGNQAPFDFDVSVKDIYSALKEGATLVLIKKELFALPPGLIDYLCEQKVTVLIWAVSALCQISGLKGFDYRVPEQIKTVMFSGESMPVKQLNIWRAALPEAMFVNLYGPTEITCNCTYHIIREEYDNGKKLPIGKAFPGRKVFLLDENRQVITETGKAGEICVSGESIAGGYYHDSKMTAEKFILYGKENALTYCTGDMAYRGEDGLLYFEGRKDFQIKHMGHRIELEEVESAINNLEGITRCCCVFQKERNRILAFYMGEYPSAELRKILKEKLPIYMVPSKLVPVEEVPLSKNGKVDRNYFKQKVLEEYT